MANSKPKKKRKKPVLSKPDLKKRGTIKKAAKALVLEKGYRGATVGDLMTSLNASPATLYHYYESKDDLYSDLCIDFLKSLAKKMAHIAGEPFPAPFKLATLAGMLIQTYQANPRAMVLHLKMHTYQGQEWRKISDRSMRQLKALSCRIIDSIAVIINEGMSQGIFKHGNPAEIADIIWGTFTGVILWFGGTDGGLPEEISVETVLGSTFDVLFSGLREEETPLSPDTADLLPVVLMLFKNEILC